MAMNYAQLQARADQALKDGDADGVLDALEDALTWPGAANTAAEWKDLCARFSVAWPGEELRVLWKKLARTPGDRDTLAELGDALLELDLPHEAATVLKRAWDSRRGDEDLMSATICALEDAQLHAEAYDLLRDGMEKRLKVSFTGRYLTAYHALLVGDAEAAGSILPQLRKHPDAEHQEMADELVGMHARFSALDGVATLDGSDVLGWHMVLNGGLLLHRADTQGGRFATLEDGPARLRHTLEVTRAVLPTLPYKVTRAWRIPDPLSAILADAAGKLLGLAVEDLPAAGSLQPGLVVAHDLDGLPDPVLDAIQWHRPEQPLLVHGACADEEPPFAADLLGALYGYIRAPFPEKDLARPAHAVKAIMDAPVDARRVKADSEAALQVLRAVMALPGRGAPGVVTRSAERRRQRQDRPPGRPAR